MTFNNRCSIVASTNGNLSNDAIHSLFGYYGDIRYFFREEISNGNVNFWICYDGLNSAQRAIEALNSASIKSLKMKIYFSREYFVILKTVPQIVIKESESSEDECADDSEDATEENIKVVQISKEEEEIPESSSESSDSIDELERRPKSKSRHHHKKHRRHHRRERKSSDYSS